MINLLKENSIGLSDVISEYESVSSSDGDIHNEKVNTDLEELCKKADVILLNGTKAGSLFKKECKKWDFAVEYHILPSTSNARGRYVKPKSEKLKQWSDTINKYRQ